MDQSNHFQLVIIGIMIFLALTAVLFLSGVIPGLKTGGGESTAPLVMWGTVPEEHLGKLIRTVNENNPSFDLTYVQKNFASYENDLIGALASGKGPDMWLLGQDSILKNKDKVFLIPFSSFSQRAFKDAFIEEAEIYLAKKGIVALPFIVDPIVLYWNRDLASGVGVSQPPKTWDEFVNFSVRLTIKDGGNIKQSGAALGEFKNIDHAKELLSLLMLQAGNPIVDANTLRSTLSGLSEGAALSSNNALRFFTEFSDPSKSTYSWNGSLPFSKNSFIAGTLAYYFGYAGEYNDIVAKNPHLNFDVAEIPQISGGRIRATFARMEGIAVSKTSPNIASALFAGIKLTEKESIAALSKQMFLPPVRRDLLGETVDNPVADVFYKSAIYSRAWLEPDSLSVFEIFKSMIESVLTGRKKISNAAVDAHIKLNNMLENFAEQEKEQQ
ncbi:MAG: hypothetical protein A3A10_01940 [Candidatus Tagabacteria bacterium RIFCSPLOWO2_01_FULL_42_9]|uniref:Sugar ABC transporter substrate-binding protein n=1 Tax=Candidatus Tagabacteria bacterium RIFCSPLOWO2_01_FULL_42_9 TaxID=1802296 RepID=A0A1G2LVP9_9BACT|nr:MAG: hypothetical protein A3A10_01940 [Candidatus Tagabacteria bacterium RIFCSPLOWO2_01_FULL_42_9]